VSHLADDGFEVWPPAGSGDPVLVGFGRGIGRARLSGAVISVHSGIGRRWSADRAGCRDRREWRN